MDSLMDAMTNVVGILLLILIISSLGISSAVKKIVENLREVTPEQLEQIKVSIDNTRENLQKLRQTQIELQEVQKPEEEVKQLAVELEEFEKDNKELTEKTSDLEEWKKKVMEQEEKKVVNDGNVQVAATELANLKAILAQTEKREVKPAKVVNMPNPRLAPDEATAHFVICKNNKVYYAGDPYTHVYRVRDVIDQNFANLAYTGKGVGAYIYSFQSTRQNDARTGYLPLYETVRVNSRFVKELGWESIKMTTMNSAGTVQPEKAILPRLFGAEERKDFAVSKFRIDEARVKAFFGDGKFGPPDFSYHISRNGTTDRLKLALGFKPDGGWTVQQFKVQGSEFDLACKRVSVSRGSFFYYYVAPDSFEVYLDVRDMTEAYKIPAGWTTWNGDRIELRGLPRKETTLVNLDALPDDEYAKLAKAVGPPMIAALKDEITNFDAKVAASVPEDITAPAEKKKFTDQLTIERREWVTRYFQSWPRQIFEAVLAASEAGGQKEVRLDVHPPEIPHTRLFVGQNPPSKPKPPPVPVDPKAPKPKPKPKPTGGPKLILD